MHYFRLLAPLLMLVLGACGTPATSNAPVAATNQIQAAATAQSSGATEATAPACGTDCTAYRVGMVQLVTHPAMDAAAKGVQDAFTASGLNVMIDAKNAQNDPATLTSILDGFRDAKVDLVVAVGTPPAQQAFKTLQGTGIPIVFNTVTNPYAAGFATSETVHPGITGAQALPPVTDAFDMIFKLKPDAKKVGIVWTSSEKNSEYATGLARDYAKSKGIEFIERQVTRTDEVLGAAESLAAEKVDAIFISTDSMVVSALEAVVKVANENDIGLFCNDPGSAARGCVTAVGVDYYDNGFLSAKVMGVSILQGTKPDDIPIQKPEKQVIVVNTAAAQQQGLTIPAEVQQMATKVLDSITPRH